MLARAYSFQVNCEPLQTSITQASIADLYGAFIINSFRQ